MSQHCVLHIIFKQKCVARIRGNLYFTRDESVKKKIESQWSNKSVDVAAAARRSMILMDQ